ncbi:hypothetical protein [Aurantiacibacter poecillastricola]|uniref:hypothetical protein n=1 Tax=Aurantiacibacter poecillastricola TaxID=3064385 RepID=UPI00273F54CD|nr:hypothetical protein [Aurantiacibacter sp. 219JJ12-13]MDP5260995.1 hypothetical protein [Aurantiacibacter sp. 219JJ12-13]
MNTIAKTVCWATVILAVAGLSSLGQIDKASATTLLIVLPILAVVSLKGGCMQVFGGKAR